jgi:hypothetical protein
MPPQQGAAVVVALLVEHLKLIILFLLIAALIGLWHLGSPQAAPRRRVVRRRQARLASAPLKETNDVRHHTSDYREYRGIARSHQIYGDGAGPRLRESGCKAAFLAAHPGANGARLRAAYRLRHSRYRSGRNRCAQGGDLAAHVLALSEKPTSVQFKEKCHAVYGASLAEALRQFVVIPDRPQHPRGQWVVQHEIGTCGALFIDRTQALRFAMIESGYRPQAAVMVPGVLELDLNRSAQAA